MNLIEELKSKFDKEILKFEQKKAKRVYIDIDPKNIIPFGSYLFNKPALRFMIASGMDTRSGIEIMYHFSDDSTGVIITLRVILTNKEKPEIDSLSNIIKGTNWIEREMHELLGIIFIGHKNLKHLILPDDWPKDDYPLRQKERK
ncbi:MAG: NADH-quinone oxidoreductase subunit C [Elusimicrobia bacterium]|nr:NADH-quinone oxidoreductase subunit C [Candidatus Liberimonas magnetica]